MKWVSIGGSWKKMNKQLENDVRKETRKAMEENKGFISGGALGVDYVATDEALKLDSTAKRIKIFLPTTIDIYIKHYRKRAKEGIITSKQAEDLAYQLEKIKKINPSSLIENKENEVVNKETYAERDLEIIKIADEAISFHVNGSLAMTKNIKNLKKRGIPLKVFTYNID